MANFFTKIFGTHSSHELKKIYPIADKVEALEEQFKKLSDEELRAKTDEFKKRYQDGETLDQLLPEAFATARLRGACSACVTTASRSSAASSCIRAVSQR